MSGARAVKKLGLLLKTHTRFPVVSVLKMQGQISAQRGRDMISIDSVRKNIDTAFEPERLKEVIVSVNSPGGSPVQCDLITSYLHMKAAKTKVPVTMFVEDIAASGGYWIACSGHEVFANKSSIIGSLGVIYAGLGFTELIKKIGVERRLLTAGGNKALMDPLSPLQDDHVKIVKKMLADTHQVFMDHVKRHRGEKLKGSDEELFSGAIWTGEAALNHGLIDGIDNLEDYIQRKYGDEVKINRVKSKYQEFAEMFGAKGSPSLQDMLTREKQGSNLKFE